MQPPRDETAERAVLAALMLRPALAPLADEILTTEAAFYNPAHQGIYKALRDMAKRQDAVDWVTVSAELVRLGEIGRFGSKAKAELYLQQIVQEAPGAAALEDYARTVREMWVRRTLINTLRETAMLAGAPAADLYAALAGLNKGSTELLSLADYRPPELIGHLAERVVDDLVDRKAENKSLASGKLPGLPTGIEELDSLLGGLRPGQFIIFAARPRDGKTTLALNIADHIGGTTGQRVPEGRGGVHFISLEMTATELAEKVLYERAGIDSRAGRAGQTTDAQDGDLEREAQGMINRRIYIDDQHGLTWPQIRARTIMARERFGTEAVLIDYIQKIKKPPRVTQTEHVTEVAQAAKALAKELRIPVIALAQLNRGVDLRRGKAKRPTLADIRDSGFLEQEADVIILLHPRRDAQTEDGTPTDLIIEKQRAGPEGVVPTLFDKRLGRFRPAPAPEPKWVNATAFGSYYEKKDT